MVARGPELDYPRLEALIVHIGFLDIHTTARIAVDELAERAPGSALDVLCQVGGVGCQENITACNIFIGYNT